MDAIINRKEVSWLDKFAKAPLETVATTLYKLRRLSQAHPTVFSVSVVCISDTHNITDDLALPPGDVLIHAGDLTQSGSVTEIQRTIAWLNAQSYRYKYIIAIAGNHENYLDPTKRNAEDANAKLDWGSLVYLQDSSTILKFPSGRRLKVFGSPWTIKSGNWAFEYPKGEDKWTARVEKDVDVLVTHSPPRRHLDLGRGDDNLRKELWRVRPKLHVFGHIHNGHGLELLAYDSVTRLYELLVSRRGGLVAVLKLCLLVVWCFVVPVKEAQTQLVNAAIVGGHRDELRRKPVVVRIDADQQQ